MAAVILSVRNQLSSQNSALGAEAVDKLITHRKTGYPQNAQPAVQFQCRIRQKCMEYAFLLQNLKVLCSVNKTQPSLNQKNSVYNITPYFIDKM
jgi:hypothetical protein